MPIPAARAARPAVADVFDDVRPDIDAVATRFARRYRTDPDDAKAAAYYYFLEAYHGYDPAGSPIRARIVFVVRARLYDEYRNDVIRRSRCKLSGDDVLEAAADRWKRSDARAEAADVLDMVRAAPAELLGLLAVAGATLRDVWDAVTG